MNRTGSRSSVQARTLEPGDRLEIDGRRVTISALRKIVGRVFLTYHLPSGDIKGTSFAVDDYVWRVNP